eukprot:CAMPEP_0119013672 /NCGR_PEP_ID=MMETSP1176-20130426/8724_1 /TAXON_ID=265551 /ORGANISM="Synedropsis recta cf, Strain CCMP1620" /LENGTH=72 /DNA_ID=CAMNT_0006966779 /DNA_START=162 /DNA_END=380 /DNA_ORIENTATION=-
MRGGSALRRGLLQQQPRTMGRRQTQRIMSTHGTRNTAPIAVRAMDFAVATNGAEVSIPRGWDLGVEDDDDGG